MSEPVRPYIGGQALIEGVMMRSPRGLSIAVRRPDGSIVVKDQPLPDEHAGLRKIPGVRGIVMLFESMALGYRALTFSAEQQLTMEEQKQMKDGGGSSAAVLISVLLALGIFIALPQGLATGLLSLLGIDVPVQSWQFHALTGSFKLLVLTCYLVGISFVPDIRRVFQYHGAEHKTIFAYEASATEPLTVERVQAQSTLHPRCGTTFLVTVVIVSIILGSAIAPLALPDLTGWQAQLATLALRIGLLPLIAAVSYELQRFSAKYCTRGPLRVLLYPGFLFQKITTREPDAQQVEVAIAAMEGAVAREREGKDVGERVRTFPELADALVAFGVTSNG